MPPQHQIDRWIDRQLELDKRYTFPSNNTLNALYSQLCKTSMGCLLHSFINTHSSTVWLCLHCDSRATGVILRLFRLLQLGSHSTPTYSGSAFHAVAISAQHAQSVGLYTSLTAQMSFFLVKCCQFPSPTELSVHVWLYLSVLSSTWAAADDVWVKHFSVCGRYASNKSLNYMQNTN